MSSHCGLLTSEAGATRANVAAGHVLAGAAVHARVGLALVVVDVAVLAAPAQVTRALVAEGENREFMKILKRGHSCKFSIFVYAGGTIEEICTVLVD